MAYKRGEKYDKEYKDSEKKLIQDKRDAKKNGEFYVQAQPKVALVIRIKGIQKIAPKPRKIMQLFRLLQIHNAVFIRLTKATKNMLTLIEPYVTFGYTI